MLVVLLVVVLVVGVPCALVLYGDQMERVRRAEAAKEKVDEKQAVSARE